MTTIVYDVRAKDQTRRASMRERWVPRDTLHATVRGHVSESFEELVVWQRAMELLVEVYQLARRLPAYESADLGSQVRRAATSIPANIAEGNARAHRREYLHFLSIARGSAAELATHLEGARRVGYVSDADVAHATQLLRRVGELLARVVASLSS